MADQPAFSKARQLGRIVQTICLVAGIAAVLIELLRSSTELTFRYGGF
ncbi:MAG TPA: hypothetical protein VIM57_11220 [Luteolibacter sp.]